LGSSTQPPSRRDFIARAAVTTVASAAALGALRLAFPLVTRAAPLRLAVGTPADFKMGTLTFLGAEELFLVHERDGFAALSARCTHLGCMLRRAGEGFACPCHGASFDRLGAVVTGPARRPLPWHRIWLAGDGRLWVDRDEQVACGTFGGVGG
jgi:cytochrome b6-f complex iron-sulfur subunit